MDNQLEERYLSTWPAEIRSQYDFTPYLLDLKTKFSHPDPRAYTGEYLFISPTTGSDRSSSSGPVRILVPSEVGFGIQIATHSSKDAYTDAQWHEG